MDSLNLYYSFQRKYSFNRNTTDESKLIEVDSLIAQICTETFNPPAPFEKSPFIGEVINMVERVDLSQKIWTSKVYISDAYIVMQGLAAYINDPRFIAKNYFEGCGKYLFNGSKIEEDEMRQIIKIKNLLKSISKQINEKKHKNNLIENASVINPPQPSPSNYADKEIYSVHETGAQLSTKCEMRLKQNQVNVQSWHDEQAGISAKLLEMQPAVSQLLKGFMSFSDNITEQYVLQFSRMQIELFNLIHDAHAYHKKSAELSRNNDYINAVCNYEEYMLSIIDHLSVFGVEEIISAPGTCFNGAIHESDVNYFSAKTALIKESARAGFRYKDIIIQKEKIKLIGGTYHENGN